MTLKKFFGILICALLLSLSSAVFAGNNTTFKDLGPNHWAYNSVMQMVNRGILEGHEDGTFRPDDSVTREQFAKVLVVSLGIPLENPDKPTFKDVSKGDWSYTYVESAADYLIGYELSDGLYFKGSDAALREDMAAAIVCAKNLQDETPDYSVLDSYTDKDKISPKSKKYVAIAVKHGIMEGYGDNIFGPQNTLTRAEACELMYKSSIIAKIDEKVVAGDTKLKAPVASYTSGIYSEPIEVGFYMSVYQNKENTSIIYTLDGTEPIGDANCSKWNAGTSIIINKTTILKARAVFGDELGPVSAYKYVINIQADVTAPKVTSTSPANGTVNVSVAPAITIKFSQKIIKDSDFRKYVEIYNASGKKEMIGISSKSFEGNGTDLIIELGVRDLKPLNYNSKYTVKVLSGYKNIYGIANEPYTFSFTTKAKTN